MLLKTCQKFMAFRCLMYYYWQTIIITYYNVIVITLEYCTVFAVSYHVFKLSLPLFFYPLICIF